MTQRSIIFLLYVSLLFIHSNAFSITRSKLLPFDTKYTKITTILSPSVIKFPSSFPVFNDSIFRTVETRLSMTTSSSLPDTESMKVGDLRKELESYGVSTKSFFEKSELVEAVNKARADGKTPINTGSTSSSSTQSSSSSSSSTTTTREERIALEVQKLSNTKVSELKNELESYGISTKSFFEKSEFVKAVAEARVDGVKKSTSSAGVRQEEYDPSYRDVIMQKMGGDARMLLQGSSIIDIRLK